MSVKTMLADPEFHTLTPAEQREALSAFDPEFSDLSDAELEEFKREMGTVRQAAPPTPSKSLPEQAWESIKNQAVSSYELGKGIGQSPLDAIPGVAPVKAGLSALGMVTSLAAPVFAGLENVARTALSPVIQSISDPQGMISPDRSLLAQNAASIPSLSEARPTTGSAAADAIADLLSGFIPVGAALKLAGKVVGLSKAKAVQTIAQESTEAARAVAKIPEEKLFPFQPSIRREVIPPTEVEIAGMRMEALRTREIQEGMAKAAQAPPPDLAKIEASRTAQITPEVPPQVTAQLEQQIPYQLTKDDEKGLTALARQFSLTPTDLTRLSAQLFGEGRSGPRTKAELVSLRKAMQPASVTKAEALSAVEAKSGLWERMNRQLFAPVRQALARTNEAGKELAFKMDRSDNIREQRFGAALADFKDVLALKDESWEAVRRFLDKGVPISDPKLQARAAALRERLSEVFEEFRSLGGKVFTPSGARKDATPIEHYFPHWLNDDIKKVWNGRDLAKKEELLKEITDHLVKTGQYPDVTTAVEGAKNYLRRYQSNIRRFGSLENARELNLPEKFYRTDSGVITEYFYEGYRRVEEMRNFGPDNAEARRLISLLPEDAKDFGEKAFRAWEGTLGTHGDLATLSNQVRAAVSISRLWPGTGLVNLTQAVGSLGLRTNVPSMLKGWKELVFDSEKSKDFALRAGSILDPVLTELAQEAGGATRMAEWYMRNVVGMTFSERINRTVSAVAGREYARGLAQKLVAKPTHAVARRELTQMGIDPETVLARSGLLSKQDELNAAQHIVNQSQFRSRITDLPAFAKSDVGSVFFQFKNFTYNQARLFSQEIGKQMLRSLKSPEEAARTAQQLAKLPLFGATAGVQFGTRAITKIGQALVAGGVASEAFDKLLPEEKTTVQFLSELAASQATGLFFDAYQSAQFGHSGLVGFIFGPSAQAGIDTADKLMKAGAGTMPPKEVLRTVARQLPTVGKFVPPRSEEEKRAARRESARRRKYHLD